MTIAGIILAFLKLAAALAGYAKDRQLLKAGQAEAIADGATDVIRSVGMANRATEAAKAPAGTPGAVWASRVQDDYSRDR